MGRVRRSRGSRGTRGVVAIGVLLALSAACAAAAAATPPSASATPPAGAPPAGLGSALAVPSATAPVPSAAQVRAALTPGLASPYLGSLVGVEVADLTTGRVLFRRNAGLPLLPASTAKLATATAALAVFGDSARLVTKVVALGTVRGGVLHGDLVLVGGGDQLLATGPASHGEYPQAARISGLAAQVAAAGIREVTGRVLGDGALFSGPAQAPGWKPDYVGDGSVAPVGALEVDGGRVQPDLATSPRVADPALAAAADLTVALRAAGVRGLQAPATTAVAPARLPARALATVAGPPLSVEVESMLTRSDDDLAESLGRLLAIHAGLPATFAGAAQAVTGELSRLGLPTAGLRLADTSGLSILDRVPARLLVAILRLDASASHPGLRPVLTGLPVAAFSGTLVFRFRTPPATRAAGLIHAKTGTLDNVTALAGTVVDRQGREVVFAILSNSAPDTDAGEAATDVVAAAIAGL